MRILIIGAKGMLGQVLAKTFSEDNVHLWDKERIDITDIEMVDEMILELNPDLIINAAANNAVDEIEGKGFEIGQLVNTEGPVNLAKAAQKTSAILVQYSSDYVFDGNKEDGYSEADCPNPISKYGETKLGGEKCIEFCDNCYVIRTSRLFGKPADSEGGKKSFVEVMLKLAEEKEFLDLVHEEYSNPTYVVDLANQTKFLIEKEYPSGIYHVANEGSCTWYEFAKEIFKQANKKVEINPVSSETFPRPAARPAFSSLRNTKLPLMRTWQESLADFLTELGINKQDEVSNTVSIPVEVPSVTPTLEKASSSFDSVSIPIELPEEKVSVSEQIEKIKKVEIITKEVNQKKNMKGIVLSGGKGTRLNPLTKITSKQLLPVYDRAMIMYPIETLLKAGIKDILVIISPEYAGQYLNLLGSGRKLGAKITYEIQEEPKGLPEAFIIGEKFIGDNDVTLILGDNIFFDHDFTEDIKSFEKGGRIFAIEVPDPERFGVVEFDETGRAISIEEKPKEPKSNFAIPGIYIYDSRVCHIAKGIKPTWRPETDITEVHKAYLAMNELDVKMVTGRWLDAGTFESLLKASNIRATQVFEEKMGINSNL